VLVVMMPMAGPAAVEGMLARIDGAIREQFEISLAEAKIGVHTAGMSAAECEWTLDDMLNRCGVDQQIGFALQV
ncbi:MAG: PelD GGDEF domain-containing protein, partial [Burkholderiaceae bacterium]